MIGKSREHAWHQHLRYAVQGRACDPDKGRFIKIGGDELRRRHLTGRESHIEAVVIKFFLDQVREGDLDLELDARITAAHFKNEFRQPSQGNGLGRPKTDVACDVALVRRRSAQEAFGREQHFLGQWQQEGTLRRQAAARWDRSKRAMPRRVSIS